MPTAILARFQQSGASVSSRLLRDALKSLFVFLCVPVSTEAVTVVCRKAASERELSAAARKWAEYHCVMLWGRQALASQE